MSDIPGTTRAQTNFLRAFRLHPFGPPPAQWPSAAVLRRWMRRKGFCDALRDVQAALRVRTDFHLAAAAAQAAQRLAQPAEDAPPCSSRDALGTLRLAHQRQPRGED